jgi:phosphotransferase system IIA component
LHTCWLLLLEEYGETFEYLPEKKDLVTVADALSRLDIDSLKIQEEEELTLLSGSENNSGTMNIYFIRDRLELKRLSGIP